MEKTTIEGHVLKSSNQVYMDGLSNIKERVLKNLIEEINKKGYRPNELVVVTMIDKNYKLGELERVKTAMRVSNLMNQYQELNKSKKKYFWEK